MSSNIIFRNVLIIRKIFLFIYLTIYIINLFKDSILLTKFIFLLSLNKSLSFTEKKHKNIYNLKIFILLYKI